MFIKTVKLKKATFFAIVAVIAAAVVLIAAVCAVKLHGGSKTYKVRTEQQRQALISEMGWECSEKPQEHKSITIPAEFDDVYEGYNELQLEQGFDLSKYKGKTAEVYTYPVYNYEGHSDCMTLTLIGCDGVLIGGNVCCTELDGFMQGIKKAQ
jgi:hypothetical protein